jgi:nucleoprotein TPR
MDQYLAQIQSLEENKNTQQSDFLKELTAQKKLVDLYKMNLDDSLKHIERLEENLTSLTNHCSEQTNSFKSKLSEVHSSYVEKMKQLDQEHSLQITDLQKQLAELSQQRDTYTAAATSSASLQITNGSSQQLEENYLPTEYELIGQGHTLTTMYSHGLQIEQELNNVRLKKQELELYLDRILKDIENKAPMIASLRRDHMRLIESHDQLTKRLDGLINENNKYKKMNAKLEKEARESGAEAHRLDQINNDLCNQIQHLLKLQNNGHNQLSQEQQSSYQQQLALLTSARGRGGGSVDAHDVITEYLVTYETIDELQKRNIQLLSIVRRLSSEQEEKTARSSLNSGEGQLVTMNQEDIQATLSHTLAELEMMREARQRMEDMVSSLIQQRDIYRAMLEDVDGTQHPRTPSRLTSGNGHGSTPSTPTSSSTALAPSRQKQLEDLQIKLKETEEALHKYQDRCVRLEHIEETLNSSLDKTREENSSLRSQLIQASSSSQFHQNRVSSLEASIKSLQNSYELLSQKKSEMDGMLLSHQRALQEKEMKLSEMNDQLRQQNELSRRVCLERDVLKEQEKRLFEQVFEQKEELKKQSQLTESMYRIETNLTSNLTSQNKKLEDEVDALRAQLKALEKSELEYKLITEQKLANTSDEIKLHLLKIQQKQSEIADLKEELMKERSQVTMAHERSVILDKQLHLLQERFQHSTSNVITNDVILNENQEKELIIQRQLLEIQKLENEVAISRANLEQYTQINLQTEKIFKEYQQKSQQTREQYEEKNHELVAELAEMKRELSEKKAQLSEVRSENESLHETLQNKTKEAMQETARAEMELNKSRELEEMNRSQVEGMKAEMIALQMALNDSNDNYERELMQHSQTIQKYKEVEKMASALQREAEEMNNKLHDITMKCMEYEKMLETQKAQSEGTISALNEQLANLKHTNDLLHNQVQIMSYEINKQTFQTIQRIASEEETQDMSASPATGAEGEERKDGDAHALSAPRIGDSIEGQQQAQQTVTELREVIKYMKREKDMLEAKYTVCEMEKARYLNDTMSLNKALDEIKVELHRELCSKGKNAQGGSSLRSEEEIQALLQDVNQLNLLRESNIHLRNENQEKSQLILNLNDKVSKLQQDLSPLSEKILLLESNLHILTTEKQSLLVDCNYWKDRLHQLISRYNDVDPEEHRLLKEKLVQTEALYQASLSEVDQQKKKAEEMEKKFLETETQLKSVIQELNSAKATAETMEKTSENLRGKLREFNKQIQSQKSLVSQLNATCDGHQQKILEHQNTIQKLQNDLTVANNATQDANAQATTAAAALATAQSLLSKQPKQVESNAPPASSEPEVLVAPSTPLEVAAAVVPQQQQQADKKSDLQTLREAAMRRMSAAKKKHVEGEGDAPLQKKPRQTPAVVAATTSTPVAVTVTPALAAAVVAPVTAVAPSPAPFAPPVQVAPVRCYYFSTPAGCRNGDNCRFQHSLEEPPSQPSDEVNEEEVTEQAPINDSPEPEVTEESQQEVSKDMEIANEETIDQAAEEEQVDRIESTEDNPKISELPTEVPVPALVSTPSTSTVAPTAPKPFGSNASFQLFSSFGKPASTTPVSTFGNLTRPAQPASETLRTTVAATPQASVPPTEEPNSTIPTPSSPFLNLRPPSPSSAKVTLQFGSGTAKLSVPANLPATGNQTAPSTPSSSSTGFKGFGSSLFRPATASSATLTPAPSVAKFGGFLQSNTPVKAFAIPTTVAAVPSVEPTVSSTPPVEKLGDESNQGMEEENDGEFDEGGDDDQEAAPETTEETTEQAAQVSLATKVTKLNQTFPHLMNGP